MVTKNTGKITVITKSHIIQFTNDVTIYCAEGKEFRIEKKYRYNSIRKNSIYRILWKPKNGHRLPVYQ